MSTLMNFINDEDGAVTIDWVALTAGVVILAVGLLALLEPALKEVVSSISTELLSADDPL